MATLGCIPLLLSLILLAACVDREPGKVQEIGFWALGWHFTATQNRIQPAIPPVIEFLRERYPGVRTAEVPAELGAEFRAAVLDAPAQVQEYLNSRFVGAYTVANLRCAAASFPVRDHGTTVAAFVVLDAELLLRPPDEWHPCPPVPPAREAGRVEALRALLVDLMNGAVRH